MMAPSLSFGGNDPVFSQTTKSGFVQRVYVMYHGTPFENVEGILARGFEPSDAYGKLLGAGIYVSRDEAKTQNYGEVCLKLLVYPGRTKRVVREEDPDRTTWQRDHGSAWVPPNCNLDMIPSGFEENCVKSKAQVRVLGVTRGWALLARNVQQMTHDLRRSPGTDLSRREKKVLHDLLTAQGILYCHLGHTASHLFLERVDLQAPSYDVVPILRELDPGSEAQMWTRSWDGCLENKLDGSILERGSDGKLRLNSVRFDGDGEAHTQKLLLDRNGKLVNRRTNTTAVRLSNGPDVVFKAYKGNNDRWKFVCYKDHILI